MMEGAFSRASRKRSRTREAPTQTNISTNSEPEIEKNGTSDSPATARARSVLPVHGGPWRRIPRGIFAPRSLYFHGFLRKSTTSSRSDFSSSEPATSAKVTFSSTSGSYTRARDLINAIGPPIPPPHIRPIKNNKRNTRRIVPRRLGSISHRAVDTSLLSMVTLVGFLGSESQISVIFTLSGIRILSTSRKTIFLPLTIFSIHGFLASI